MSPLKVNRLLLTLVFMFSFVSCREPARSLEDEGLRCSTVLMNFSPTKLDHDVSGLKGRLQGFNWPFATCYMVKAVGNYYFSFCFLSQAPPLAPIKDGPLLPTPMSWLSTSSVLPPF